MSLEAPQERSGTGWIEKGFGWLTPNWDEDNNVLCVSPSKRSLPRAALCWIYNWFKRAHEGSQCGRLPAYIALVTMLSLTSERHRNLSIIWKQAAARLSQRNGSMLDDAKRHRIWRSRTAKGRETGIAKRLNRTILRRKTLWDGCITGALALSKIIKKRSDGGAKRLIKVTL